MFFKWHLSMHKALLVLLVDAVVGQVDEVVAYLCWVVTVLGRSKPHQAFFIDIDLDRFYAGQQDVETQVKLQTIYKERVVNIFLI